MFFLKKIITAFILPPGLFILALILSGTLLIFWNHRKIGFFNLAVGFMFWIFCSTPFSSFLISGLESEFNIPQKVHGDVIILLGGGVIDNAPDFSGYGTPTGKMFGRIVTAVRLQKKMNIPIIVSGGTVYKSMSSEAVIAKRFLIDLGVKEDQILVEEKSRDTYENAKYTTELCRRNDYENPILVTSASHMKRTLLSFKKFNINAIPFPSNFKSRKIYYSRWRTYLPSSSRLMQTSEAFHEYLGIFFYKLVY